MVQQYAHPEVLVETEWVETNAKDPSLRIVEIDYDRTSNYDSGHIPAPPEYPSEQAQRGGHIPGAKNIPWSQAVNDTDGSFKSKEELEALYSSKGANPDKEVITYCRIGERSSHTWFVLKYLLGYLNVKNYDGSWSEWGNSIKTTYRKIDKKREK